MDTMSFYFDIYEIRCRKHSTSKQRENDKEKRAIEKIHSKSNNEGKKNE